MNDLTFVVVLPPLIAIALALITKEVLSSLIIGIISGALIYTNFNVVSSLNVMFTIMGDRIGSNASIILFLCLLGVLVTLMTRAGGSKAYGEWAKRKIKSRSGAMLATSALGAIIFVDDYFNCLTVGTVMRPVTDAHKISRAKLAYIIDSTAAPICIIAPISSWAVAVGSTIQETHAIDNGFSYFLQTIPYNFYAILTIITVIVVAVLKFDFGKMKKIEDAAKASGDVTNEASLDAAYKTDVGEISEKGKVIDLVLPVLSLIFLSIAAMIYTGYQNILTSGGTDFSIINIFGSTDVNISIIMGSFTTIIITMVLYLARKVLSFKDFMSSVTVGIKSMVPAITILALAWTLSGICDKEYLQTGNYVGMLIKESGMLLNLVPPIIFLVAGLLAFATGTSWGTFGIMIPIVVAIFAGGEPELLLISISATLAGAVYGDHISPISDTTILSSTGANCDHLQHVKTQMPYATMVATACFFSYLVAGFIKNPWISLIVSIAFLAIAIVGVMIFTKRKETKEKA